MLFFLGQFSVPQEGGALLQALSPYRWASVELQIRYHSINICAGFQRDTQICHWTDFWAVRWGCTFWSPYPLPDLHLHHRKPARRLGAETRRDTFQRELL